MRILLTNDDGIDGPGLEVLVRILAKQHEVIVVAPDKQHSGGSHRITFNGPVHVKPIGPTRFECDGTPADCTRIALGYICPGVDWVISGINAGANLGTDIFLSGTVAAAREAMLLGTSSIAISQYVGDGRSIDWDKTQQLAATVLQNLLSREKPAGKFWNANLPDLTLHDDLHSIATEDCLVDLMPLPNNYHREGDRFVYQDRYHNRQREEGTDVDVCLSGKISISLI